MLLDFVLLVIGLPLLYFGGDLLITGSVRVSRHFKISPFIVGATVIGFGTSSPELAVSLLATLQGAPELAMGNIIGSNIANVGLVLGLTALFIPLAIDDKRLNLEAPALLIPTLLILYFAWNLNVSRFEGIIMLVLLVVYLWRSFSQKEEDIGDIEEGGHYLEGKGIGVQVGLILAGFVLLVLGGKLLVDGGVGIATALGISEWLIGISIIAVGTSLPEIVSSLIAAKRGHGDMAIGNIFGSNIFNILMVLGTTSAIHPMRIQENIHPDLIITSCLTCLLILLIRIGHALSKWDGLFLLACYAGYMGTKALGII